MILVVGATGSLGGTTARLLLERGERVRALVRPASPSRASFRHTPPEQLRTWGAELVDADLRAPETLASAVAGATAVVCSASATKRSAPDTLASVDVDGVAALARAAAAAGVRQFVLVSTHGADPGAERAILRVKGQGEAAVRGAGVPATVLHPTKFMQDWIGFVIGAQVAATLGAGRPRVQLVGEGETVQSFVDEVDVASLAAAVVGRADAVGETIPIAAEATSYRDVVARLGRRLGREITVESLPLDTAEVDTVPAPVAATIASLLAMAAASGADTLTTPDVPGRFGATLGGIDAYLKQWVAMLAPGAAPR